jgi:diguanylate cyclase (GGDEF)-like protein
MPSRRTSPAVLAGLSVRARLTAVLVVLCGTALVSSAVAYFATNSLLNDLTVRSEVALSTTLSYAELAQALSDEETGLRGYVLTSDEAFIQPYTDGRQRETELIGELLSGANAHGPAFAASLDVVRTRAETWHAQYADPVIADIGSGDLAGPRSIAVINQGKQLFDDVRAGLESLGQAIGQPDAVVLDRIDFISRARQALAILSQILIVLSVIVAARLVARWVNRPIERLVTTARRVEAGDDVSFPSDRSDEIGDLGAALEGMRRRLHDAQVRAEANASQSTVVNRFTELTGFLSQDGQVAEAVLVAMDELVAPDRGVVHISNRSQDRAIVEAGHGDVSHDPLSLGALAECPGLKRGGLYVTPDVGAPLAVRCPVVRVDDGTVACIPLTALGESVGAAHIQWNRRDALTLEQRPSVMRIAEHSALAIANRRLVQALQGMASTDARTGLSNSRFFDQALETALEASDSEIVSVLMLDLDHFKMFNDRFGHPAGDEALRTFAGILSGSVREGELVARYGGEEFAVLLRGLDTPAAVAVAERIRARTEATILSLGPGTSAHISVSIGVATAPYDAFDRIGLLRAADAALYRAKALGRNRVVAAGSGDGDRDEAGLQAS